VLHNWAMRAGLIVEVDKITGSRIHGAYTEAHLNTSANNPL
jgi:hypothetical protein